MDTWLIVVIAIAVLAVIGLLALNAARRRRTERLRDRFGPEYERTVEGRGRRGAESELQEREARREQIQLRDLEPGERERFAGAWKNSQAEFVDSPEGAVGNADDLVQDVMRARGYPVEDFDQRSADISVDHPGLVQDYRAAHGITLAHQQGQASTEDLRQAMVHYRSLFAELLGERQPERRSGRFDAGAEREGAGDVPAGSPGNTRER